MQNSWTMNIKRKCNVSHKDNPWQMSHSLKLRWPPVGHLIFFLIILEILHDSWSMNFCFLILDIAIRYHQVISGDILIPILSTLWLLGRLTKKYLLVHFRKKFPTDLFIWQIYTAMSVNYLINFWEQTILKWRSSGHFQFEYCNFVIFKQLKIKAK